MASSWGSSWLDAFGNSWGEVTVDPNAMVGSTTFGFMAEGTLTASVPVETEQNSGGYLPYKNHPWLSSPIKRYIEEVEPEIVEAVIEVVAKTVEKRTVQNKDVEAAQAEKALRERLLSQHQEWKEMYAQLIRLEYERREQEYEDAQIAMLLFEM